MAASRASMRAAASSTAAVADETLGAVEESRTCAPVGAKMLEGSPADADTKA